MQDSDCVPFLQWALPRIGLRWPAFRRVRRQVCRRLAARVQQLGLSDAQAYRAYLERNPAEWARLEAMCGITISRFCRDRIVFDRLAEQVLPQLARGAGPGAEVRVWSAGCASGEEPYSLSLIWTMRVAERFPGVALCVLASDRDPQLIARATRACYRPSSLRELPCEWVERAFDRTGDELCLAPALRRPVSFEVRDIRRALADGPFQLILCRNLAFSYFDDSEQRRVLQGLLERLTDDGHLVIGARERLPDAQPSPQPVAGSRSIYPRAELARAAEST